MLDLEGSTVFDEELKLIIVESKKLAKAGKVKIFKKEIVRRRNIRIYWKSKMK